MLVNPISALYPSSGGLQFRLHSRDKSFENSTCIRRVFLCTFDILMCLRGVTTPNFGEIKGRHLTSGKKMVTSNWISLQVFDDTYKTFGKEFIFI